MHGPATGTISPLQRATADNACQLVNGRESTRAPTTNQVAPQMDFANVLWETVLNKTLNPSKYGEHDLAYQENQVVYG